MPKRPRSQVERERQLLRQRMQRIYARCIKYGIHPWEFYYWTQLKWEASELMRAKAQGKVGKNYSLRDWIEHYAHEDASKTNMHVMLARMGKVTGDPIAAGLRQDPRPMRLDFLLAGKRQ